MCMSSPVDVQYGAIPIEGHAGTCAPIKNVCRQYACDDCQQTLTRLHGIQLSEEVWQHLYNTRNSCAQLQLCVWWWWWWWWW